MHGWNAKRSSILVKLLFEAASKVLALTEISALFMEKSLLGLSQLFALLTSNTGAIEVDNN